MEVKILTYLEVSDLDYLDKIYDGLFISTKTVPKNDIEISAFIYYYY